ncbi:hypothetical protein L195_g014651 [Trifolium pratense]|uniref:MMS19 nucleotide excision repair protein n=1 Tax=Trifolium pratense TaxID=57577 RepID=A0A2K3PRI2_TRIPR|nr:hypothetical protein L195_g014651 [Trifolium pratense]
MSYRSFVVDKTMELLSLHDIALPFSLKVEALSDIGMTGMKNMLTILQGLEGTVFANLSEVRRNLMSSEIAVQLLECYSCKLTSIIASNQCHLWTLMDWKRKRSLPLIEGSHENNEEQKWDPLSRKCAAEAFHVLMSDAEVCLNKTFHATIQPLYKQRFFSSMMPIFQQLISRSDSSLSR